LPTVQPIVRPQAFTPNPNSVGLQTLPKTKVSGQALIDPRVGPNATVASTTPKRIILIQPPAAAFQPAQPRIAGLPQVAGVPQVAGTVDVLAWDAESKENTPLPGVMSTDFTFNLTNISSAEVLINRVHTSCGCTVAKLPEQPWRIAPGGGGPIAVAVNLAGKMGTFTKMVTVETSHGSKTLYVKVNITPPAAGAENAAAGAGGNNMNRLANMQAALADRQAVFKNDCASCHAETALDKSGQEVHGKELYAAVCGICHDSPHRAGMVPDLYTLRHPTDAAYWKQWIASGKAGTMMPAFAKAEGGPLSDGQVSSLVKHLMETVTHKPTAKASTSQIVPIGAPQVHAAGDGHNHDDHAGHAHDAASAAPAAPRPPTLLAAPPQEPEKK
jgi:mono/diheme cytochrome c family protein